MTLIQTDSLKESVIARPERVPAHVAIIMDGNGRWAAARNLPRTDGHEAGVKAVRTVVKAAHEIGIRYLTLYTFSVENWQRPRGEVAALMTLLARTTIDELDDLMKNDVRLIVTGRIQGIPRLRRVVLEEAVHRTRRNKGLVLNLALNYGGRSEILDAVRGIATAVRSGRMDISQIDEAMFASFLYTAGIPDPDLLIRTSGEQRISNFLLWQTSYTELCIIDTLWPDFGRTELFQCVADFQRRERRFGKVSSQSGEPDSEPDARGR